MSNTSTKYCLGVEWIGEQFRAGVFDESWRLVGKASRSAKSERGMDEMLKRMARCALDAVDDADLQPVDLSALGVLTEHHAASRALDAQQVNELACHFPPQLGSNLLLADRIGSILWAVHEHDLSRGPQSWLGLFSDSQPVIVAAERALPGRVKMVVNNAAAASDAGCDAESALLKDCLSAIRRMRCDTVILVGREYEDAQSPGVKLVREFLSSAGANIKLHVPEQGAHVGVWAAARLAAGTFGQRPFCGV